MSSQLPGCPSRISEERQSLRCPSSAPGQVLPPSTKRSLWVLGPYHPPRAPGVAAPVGSGAERGVSSPLPSLGRLTYGPHSLLGSPGAPGAPGHLLVQCHPVLAPSLSLYHFPSQINCLSQILVWGLLLRDPQPEIAPMSKTPLSSQEKNF